MKKFLCLLMVAVMLCGLVGCMPETDDDVRGSIANDQNNEEKVSLGKTENNTYRNDFLGLSCTLSSEWIFYTEEEILEMNDIVKDAVDEDVADAIENANIIYDMYASNPNDYSSVNVNMEKYSAVQIGALNLKTVLESQFATIIDTYENMGYTNVQVKYEKITVDGKEFDGAMLTADIADLEFTCIIFCFKKSRYIANITIGSLDADTAKTILGCFSVD